MSDKLLPCPFCGGNDCGAVLFDKYFHEGFAEKESAIATWNTRAQPAQDGSVAEELARALEAVVNIADTNPSCSVGFMVEHGVSPNIRTLLAKYRESRA